MTFSFGVALGALIITRGVIFIVDAGFLLPGSAFGPWVRSIKVFSVSPMLSLLSSANLRPSSALGKTSLSTFSA